MLSTKLKGNIVDLDSEFAHSINIYTHIIIISSLGQQLSVKLPSEFHVSACFVVNLVGNSRCIGKYVENEMNILSSARNSDGNLTKSGCPVSLFTFAM